MSEKLEGLSSPNRSTKKRNVAVGAVAVVLASSAALTVNAKKHNPRTSVKATPTTLEIPETTSTTLPTTATTIENTENDLASEFKIIGNEAFQTDINAALEVIKNAKDKTYWLIVQQFRPTFIADPIDYGVDPETHIVTVNEQERHYIGANTGDPKQDQANESNNKNWLSSSIVHEGFIGEYLSTNPSVSTATAENLALYVQGQFLTNINGDSNQINSVNNRIDTTDSPASYWNQYKNGHIQPDTTSTTS